MDTRDVARVLLARVGAGRGRRSVVRRPLAGSVVGLLLLVSCGDGMSPEEEPLVVPDTTAATSAERDPSMSDPSMSDPDVGVRPAPPSTGSSSGSAASRRPEGFDTVVVTVTSADGETCELCLWLAADDARRRRGLMFVDDLGPADGMAFVYDAPRTTAFTMRNTVLPLTIVFHGPDGTHLDAFDMDPCEEEPCPTYPTPEGFTVAVEVEQGRADELGLVPGSALEIVSVAGPEGCGT